MLKFVDCKAVAELLGSFVGWVGRTAGRSVGVHLQCNINSCVVCQFEVVDAVNK